MLYIRCCMHLMQPTTIAVSSRRFFFQLVMPINGGAVILLYHIVNVELRLILIHLHYDPFVCPSIIQSLWSSVSECIFPPSWRTRLQLERRSVVIVSSMVLTILVSCLLAKQFQNVAQFSSPFDNLWIFSKWCHNF